jgi:hypothetical protein
VVGIASSLYAHWRNSLARRESGRFPAVVSAVKSGAVWLISGMWAVSIVSMLLIFNLLVESGFRLNALNGSLSHLKATSEAYSLRFSSAVF